MIPKVLQNLKKNWLVVWKMIWGIWQIFIRTLETVKIGIFMGPFCPKYKIHELQIYRGVIMTLKNDEKSEEELTCRFKIDIRNLTNFYSSTWVWKIYTLMGCFWPKYIIFERKKYRGDIFHETRQWCKIWRKLSCGSENDMRNLAKFHQNTQKSQNWDLYCVLLSKVENVWA